jgi:hypothetical protein
MNGHQTAIQFNHRISPRQVSIRSFTFRMLDSPGNDFPTIPGFQNLPFSPVGPVLFLLQNPLRHRDLLTVASVRILGMLHVCELIAASAEQ